MMTLAEKKLASKLLGLAADEFGNHGCNDFHLVKDGGLSEGDALEIVKSIYRDGCLEEPTDSPYTSDCLLMRWLSKRVLEAAPTTTGVVVSHEALQRETEDIRKQLRRLQTGEEIESDRLTEHELAQQVEIDALKAKVAELEAEASGSVLQGHKRPCYYCGEPCNAIAASPSKWPIPLCHSDEPGVVKWHHIGCVSSRLVDQSKPPQVPPGFKVSHDNDLSEWYLWMQRGSDWVEVARSYNPPDIRLYGYDLTPEGLEALRALVWSVKYKKVPG